MESAGHSAAASRSGPQTPPHDPPAPAPPGPPGAGGAGFGGRLLRRHRGVEAGAKLVVDGRADLIFQDVASRVTTLDRLGTYRLSLDGAQGQVMLGLATESGALQLSGAGSLGPDGMRFRGEASASEAERGALSNLLNIIGRREGDRSVISIG